MFIALDIGNTNITVGVLRDNLWSEYRIGTNEEEPLVYYTQQLAAIAEDFDMNLLEGVVISSVVPDLTKIIFVAAKQELHSEPIIFDKKWYSILPISSANPDEIGTDMLANALAVYCKGVGPCLIIDFGTALTYTLVNNQNVIEGVAIAPGLKTAMQALSGNAAQLPEIPLELPAKPLGTNTVEAMNAGILWGFVGQVIYMINRIRGSVDYDITVIATGGLSEVLEPLKPHFDTIDRNLTVQGIYEFFKLASSAKNVHGED